MRKRLLILIAIILGTLLLSFSLVFLRHRFEEAQSSGVEFIFSKEDYIFGLIFSTLLLTVPAFTLGFISWSLFKKKQSDKVLHFIVFNFIGLTLLLLANSNEIYKIWHYNKYQANIDYNESLTKRNGGFLDTCMIMVQNDIKRHGVLPNDYRILSYSYDQELTTIPRDTTNRYYSFDIIYSKRNSDTKTVRAASYFINFNHKFKRVYDVDTKDEKAKNQIERLKKNFKDLKNVLERFPDSTNNHFDKIERAIKPVRLILQPTGVLLQVRLDGISMGILSLSTSAGQDKLCWAFVC